MDSPASVATKRDELRIVCFLFSLPFPLPLPEDWSFSISGDVPIPVLDGVPMIPDPPGWLEDDGAGRMFTFFRFYRVGVWGVRHLTDDVATRSLARAWLVGRHEVAEPGPPAEAATWVVSVQTPLNALPSADPLDDALERCIQDLARAVDAMRVSHGVFVPSVRRETLPPTVLYMTRGPDDNDWSEPDWLQVNQRLVDPPALPALTNEGRAHWRHTLRLLALGWPVTVTGLHLVNARAALDVYGEASDSIVKSAIGCEALLDGTLELMLWEEGASAPQVAKIFIDTTVTHRVKSHFPPRLGGSWHMDGDSPIALWRRRVADVRNGAVHRGSEPTREQAQLAVNASSGLHRFLVSRAAAQVGRYPRLALAYNGMDGLEAQGVVTDEVRERYEREGRGHTDFAREFADWLRTVGRRSSRSQ